MKKRKPLTPKQKEAKKINACQFYSQNKEYHKNYYRENEEKILLYQKEYYLKRKLAILQGNNL